MTRVETPSHDALYRLIAYARDEARELRLPLVEHLLGVALEELGEAILAHAQVAHKEKRI